ncbi:kinase-like domain-containing protein [Flagelloscypha sp. PMI_526]|nr:kinase-like domain-containing protein [Flagelloscypha sp. PMI_526]
MEVEQEDQDNGERGDASSPSLPLKKASSKPQIRITTPALPNTPPPTVPHIPIPPLSHEPSPLGVAPIYAPSPLSSPGTPHSFGTTSSALPTPIAPLGGTPFLGRLLSPLEEWIERDVDAKEYYTEVTEIAEGESGFVCSAVLNPELAASLPLDDDFPTGERTVGHMGKVGLLTKLSVMNKAVDVDYLVRGQQRVLAIKAVTLPPPSSQQASGGMLAIETPTDRKLKALSHELTLLRDLSHANILLIDSLYLVPPTGLASQLWIRMELMDRSLADVIGLIPFGLMVLERMIARLAGDLMSGLEYLHGRGVVHRDVRSDNCLLDHDGVLKLTDFSNAISVEPAKLILLPMAGVLFYQAPEVRILPQAYDPFKLDVYSAGATVWEMANGDGNPPWFDESGDTSLAQNAQGYPPIREERRSFWTKPMWDFLNLCEKRADERPSIEELVKMSGPFLGNASGRPVIVQLLAQATNIETRLNEAEAGDGMERDDAE